MRIVLMIGLTLLAACAEGGGKYSQDSLIGTSRPPKHYPQQGYLLDDSGTYSFKASALTRN